MAKVKGKGTVLEQYISAAYAAVAQVISIGYSGMEAESYEADTLDNSDAGVPYEPTGRVQGGSFDLELFLDPALAGHKALLDVIEAPAAAAASTKTDFQLTFADTGTTTWPFLVSGGSWGTTVAMSDGVKATCSLKVNKLPTFP